MYILNENYKEAEDYTLKALKLDPLNYKYFQRLGIVYYYINQYDNALSLILKSIELQNDDYNNLLLLAYIYDAKSEYDEAIKSILKYLEHTEKTSYNKCFVYQYLSILYIFYTIY